MYRMSGILDTACPICNIGRLMPMRSARERSAFGQRMYDSRKRAKLTQQDVEKRTGISQSNLSDLEGTAEGSTFVPQLAKLYRVSAHWLATGTGEMEMLFSEWADHRKKKVWDVLRVMPDPRDSDPEWVEYKSGILEALITVAEDPEPRLNDEERALLSAYRDILPEQREAAAAELFARAAEARKYKEHFEKLTGTKGAVPDHKVEHLRAPAHTPPAPKSPSPAASPAMSKKVGKPK